MKLRCFFFLSIWTAAWTSFMGWVYLNLADGLISTSPAKVTLQVVCLVGLLILSVRATANSWREVLVDRPMFQTAGFLIGVGVALLVSGHAFVSIGAEFSRLLGIDFLLALVRPLAATFALVFLPLSVFAFAVAAWRQRRKA